MIRIAPATAFVALLLAGCAPPADRQAYPGDVGGQAGDAATATVELRTTRRPAAGTPSGGPLSDPQATQGGSQAPGVSDCAERGIEGVAAPWTLIVVDAPVTGSTVAPGFEVTGCLRVRNAAVDWRLRDGTGAAVAEGQASPLCADCAGPFEFAVEFPPPLEEPQIGTLEVYAVDGTDGTERDPSAVAVVLTSGETTASSYGENGGSACLDPDFAEAAAGLAFIMVDEPAPGSEVEPGFAVRGCANVFEATVEYRLRHADGSLLAEGFTTASCGTGCVGALDFEVDYGAPEEPAPATLELFSRSMRDGSETSLVAVPLQVR